MTYNGKAIEVFFTLQAMEKRKMWMKFFRLPFPIMMW